MPENIRRHTETVTKIAVFLAERLRSAGEPVNVPLVEAAGLLHDIAKYPALSTHEHHGMAGKRIIEKKGY